MNKEKHFVGYITAGDGGIKKSLDYALALINGGITMLEIGVPFSDPIADGPVIQRAMTRALKSNTTLKDIIYLTKEIRKHSNIPLILFSYLNPLLSVQNTDFFKEAKLAGINGVLIVDCPMEAAQLNHDLEPIYVITPNTSISRIQELDKSGKGFLYYACRKGTTGIKAGLPDDFVEKIQLIKSHATLPVVTGFGISTREMAEKVLEHADGFVVGSLFVKAIEDGMTPAELTCLAKSLNPL
ncbi:MAG TPA: tryptophan synthase subunit alpha [Gammaproteobacteria bacterium]|nr:tryptophan synthase subunit alpha [Gammaproteobacteria bacterium]